ncbi:MAG: HNH endonuclease family protein, partial [Ktedonobacterales bacterium]
SGDFYLMQATPRQYVLLRLDSSLAGTEAVYTYKTLTVEHVLPRNPAANSEWLTWFPTLEDRANNVHHLGNLVLLSRWKNAQASNYDFARKKDIYFGGRNGVSPFALTTQVLREQEWTPQIVQRRQRELIAHLRQLWRL